TPLYSVHNNMIPAPFCFYLLFLTFTLMLYLFFFFFFFNATATTEIYTLSLHDALPISTPTRWPSGSVNWPRTTWPMMSSGPVMRDRKSTRLNSSHVAISYAVFCLKKKKKNKKIDKHVKEKNKSHQQNRHIDVGNKHTE